MNPSTALHWKAGPVGANGPIFSDPWIASQAEVPKSYPLTDQGRALKHLRWWGLVEHGQVRVLVQWALSVWWMKSSSHASKQGTEKSLHTVTDEHKHRTLGGVFCSLHG